MPFTRLWLKLQLPIGHEHHPLLSAKYQAASAQFGYLPSQCNTLTVNNVPPLTKEDSQEHFSMTMPQTTIYTALNSTQPQIRILRILPALQLTDPIHCQLRSAFFDNETPGSHPHYEALSYVWGQDQHSFPVYVDGVPMTVTVNLYGALQHL